MAIPKTEKQRNNIVMFPFMAYGHINPFVALAKQLHKRNKLYTITIVNTPLNIQELKASSSLSSCPNYPNINLVEIPFCGTEYGFPSDVQNTDNMSLEMIARFMIVSEELQSPFKRIILDITEQNGGSPPLCIISDMFFGWTVEVAKELGIYHSVFIASSGYSMAIYFSTALNAQECKRAENEEHLSLPDFPEAGQFKRSQLWTHIQQVIKFPDFYLYLVRQLSFCLQSDSILLNNIEGLGQVGKTYFIKKMGGKPVWNVGPAINLKDKVFSESCDNIYSSWLDLHPPGSVLYVSFGSQHSISASQMKELAKGLESCGRPFIWVIRPPIGFNATEDFQPEWFPDGFVERIRKNGRHRGFLVHKWAPQQEILGHKSTGAFLSHCGWNSVLESLLQGIPIIGWPLTGEQFYNSHLLEQLGVCTKITEEVASDQVIEHDHIAKVIKMVMEDSGSGDEMRRKASNIKWKMIDAIREEDGFNGASIKAMDEFLNTTKLKN